MSSVLGLTTARLDRDFVQNDAREKKIIEKA